MDQETHSRAMNDNMVKKICQKPFYNTILFVYINFLTAEKQISDGCMQWPVVLGLHIISSNPRYVFSSWLLQNQI